MSVFCPNCRKRLVLEDYRIKSYRNVRELATGGDIVVEKKGHIKAQIKAGNLTVRGKVNGPVSACGAVHISKTGSLEGDLEAPVLTVESGAVLIGFLRIGPPASEAVVSAPLQAIPADPEPDSSPVDPPRAPAKRLSAASEGRGAASARQ